MALDVSLITLRLPWTPPDLVCRGRDDEAVAVLNKIGGVSAGERVAAILESLGSGTGAAAWPTCAVLASA